MAEHELADVYYVALLRFVGCTADAAETAVMAGGDDLAFNASMAPALNGAPREQLRALVGATGKGLPPHRRAGALAAVLRDPKGAEHSLRAHL